MITDIQKKWLNRLVNGELTKQDDPHKHSVYMNRIRERVDHGFDNLRWMAENTPDLLRDEEHEIQKFGVINHRRLKDLMLVIKILYPRHDPALIKLKNEIRWP